ncbi:MAG: phage antirepressor [Peptoniphilaceae bacterium]
MNRMKIYTNKQFGDLRILTDRNINPWFVGIDIARSLGYSNTRDALSRHVDEEDKATVGIHDGRQKRNTVVINESGLYSLILSSRLPQARDFKRWVTKEVLPSIRKYGGYILGQDNMSNEELLSKALKLAENIIEENKSKVEFAESILGSEDSILIGNLAKLLYQNGIEIGRNRLFKDLREDGFLICAKGEAFNTPTQRAVELGVLEVQENIYYQCGEEKLSFTTKVTAKGQDYFIKKYKSRSLLD